MSSNEFRPEGVYPALPTPINQDASINYEAAENHIEYLEEGGVHGVVPAGCTGHSASLGDKTGEGLYDEHVEFVSRISEMTDLDVVAGDGMNTTEQTIELAEKVEEEADIDAHLMITPYQNCPPQDLVVRHYEEVARQLDEPIVAYNVPGRTGRNIEPETVEDIAEIEGIIGLKEASNDPEQIKGIGERLEKSENHEFYLGSGDDERNPLIYESGGTFAITVSGNVAPSSTVEVWEEGVENENYEKSKKLNQDLMDLHDAMFQDGEKNPISVQYALNRLGFEFGTPRMPLDRKPREDEEYSNRTEIENVLEELEIL